MKEISYYDLAKRVGDMVLNIYIRHQEDLGEWDIYNGEYEYCYVHETKKECEKDSDKCEYEYYEIYQDYIITESGAEYLKTFTNEIVFYNERLNMYIWGITHFGTSWDGVFTKIRE